MAVRIGKFGMSWLQPAGQAADLLVEAGRAKGAGIAALGQGIGQGIQAFGQNRRAKQIRSEDMALREQSRQDMLAERAADNARQDAEFAMRQDAWKVDVLTANRDKAAQEAALLGQIAADTGDEAAAQRAKAAESEAMRFGTALDTLLSSRMNVQGAAPRRGGGDVGGVQVGGKPMSQMTNVELDALMSKSERGEVDYTYRGGATGDMGQGVGPAAPSLPSPSMVNDGGVMSGSAAPMPTAATPAMPQVDPRNPYVLMETAKARMEHADKMLRTDLSAAARNSYQRLRLESAAQYGFAQSLLKDQEQAKKAQAEAEADASYAARLTADARSAGYKGEPFQTKDAALKWLEGRKQVNVAVDKDTLVTDPNKALAFQRAKEMAEIKNSYSLGRMAQSEETKKRLIDYAAAHGKSDDPQFKMLNTMRDNAVDSARSLYAAADNDTISKAAATVLMKRADEEMARVKEFDKQMAMLFDGAAAPKTAAPAPAPAAGAAPSTPAPAGESTVDRLKRLWKR